MLYGNINSQTYCPPVTSRAERERFVVCIVANHENWHMTRTQDRIRDAAKQMPAHTPTPVCSHDDEIGFKRLCSLHNRAWDACTVRIDYLRYGAHAAPRAQLARVVEFLLRRVLCGRVERLRFDHTDHPAAVRHIVRDNTRHHYPPIGGPRQLEHIFERQTRAAPAVESRENSFVHDRSLKRSIRFSVREEQSRIARELHDDLGQQLTALKMHLSSLELAPGTDAHARAQLGGMQCLIDATVASMRRIAADLRPVMLDDLGLVPAIDWLVNDFTNRYGIEVERRMDGMHNDFSHDGSTTIFRIVQEALTNVARHSHAAHVALELHQEAEHCNVRITDDGRGADEHADARRKAFGLIEIRERASRLNGSVSIQTSVGQGFAVTVMLPPAAVQDDERLSDWRETFEDKALR